MPRLYRQTAPGFALRIADAKPGQTVTLEFRRVRRKPRGRSRGKAILVVVDGPEEVQIRIDGEKPIVDTT